MPGSQWPKTSGVNQSRPSLVKAVWSRIVGPFFEIRNGTGSDAVTFTETGAGTKGDSGVSTDAVAFSEAPTGAKGASGTGSDAVTFSEVGVGSNPNAQPPAGVGGGYQVFPQRGYHREGSGWAALRLGLTSKGAAHRAGAGYASISLALEGDGQGLDLWLLEELDEDLAAMAAGRYDYSG